MEGNAWHVYLVKCADGTLYCGIAKDPVKRLAEHNGVLPGGARYTRGRRPVVLLASKTCSDKARPREEKLSFMQNDEELPCKQYMIF